MLAAEVAGEQFGVACGDSQWITAGASLRWAMCTEYVFICSHRTRNIIRHRQSMPPSLFLLSVSLNATHHNLLNLCVFKSPILQSCFLIALFIFNQHLRQDSAFSSPSPHTAAITAFVISYLLLQTALIVGCFPPRPHCRCWISCSGLIALL